MKSDLRKANDTLTLAKTLLDKLGDEKVRWEQQSKNIELEFKSFPMDSLLAACFTIYLSDADENIREKFLKEWK